MDELSLDHCFWRKISSCTIFRQWLVSQTRFRGLPLSLVTSEKWHQRWYRDPETKRGPETDILLIFADSYTGDRYALHIENKPAYRTWEPDQARNYLKRAANRMKAWRYVDFQTVLSAPSSFIRRHPHEASHFHLTLSYEEVGRFVPEFAAEVDMAQVSLASSESN